MVNLVVEGSGQVDNGDSFKWTFLCRLISVLVWLCVWSVARAECVSMRSVKGYEGGCDTFEQILHPMHISSEMVDTVVITTHSFPIQIVTTTRHIPAHTHTLMLTRAHTHMHAHTRSHTHAHMPHTHATRSSMHACHTRVHTHTRTDTTLTCAP